MLSHSIWCTSGAGRHLTTHLRAGLVYCLEFLEENLDWLIEQLAAHPSTRRVAQRLVLRRAEAYPCLGAADTYFLFDCPGQVELYTHHESLTHILERLVKAGHRVWCGCACHMAGASGSSRPVRLRQLTAVHLVDAQHCSDSGHFIAMALTSLATMMRLELPHINVLSKVDLFQRFGEPRACVGVVLTMVVVL